MAEDYTYQAPQYPPQTGTQLLHNEIAALREQVAKLTQEVRELKAAQRPQPVAVNVVYDWED
jgi:hypothetical protein